MGLINTYTASKCGFSTGQTWEVSVAGGLLVPTDHLAVVKVSENPTAWVCCVIERDTVNQTDESLVKPVQDSGYELHQCAECQAHWS